MLRLKLWSARGESHHPIFVGNWPTIIRTFSALSIHYHWMSSPSRKWECGVSPRFESGVNQENYLIGRVSPRFTTPMVENSSADLLPAIKTYRSELHLEFTLWLNPGQPGEHLIRGHQGQDSGGSWLVAGLESADAPQINCCNWNQLQLESWSFFKLP